MKRKKLSTLLLVLVALVMVVSPLVAGGGKEASPSISSEADKELYKNVSYPWIGAVLELPYFIPHQRGLKYAELYYGADTSVLGPSSYDMSAQEMAITQQISQKPTAMFISAFEDTLAPSINEAVDAGIPVFTIDMDTTDSKRQTFIGGSTIDYGRTSARTLAEGLNGRGEVLLIYKMGQNSQEQRAAGFRMEMEENYPGITIVQEVNSETDTSKDADMLKAALQANPKVTGVGCMVASGAVGAATAVRELGRSGEVLIIGDDKDNATLKLVESGELYATIAINTISENWYAAMLVDGLIRGNVSISADDKAAGVTPLPSFVDIGTFPIYKDTAKYFYLPDNPFDMSNFKVTPKEKDETYYLIGAVLELPYFIDHRIGFEAAGKELGVTTRFIGPSNYDMQSQMTMIEQAITQKPAGLLVMAFEDTLAPAIDKAVEAGIPVVTIDMDSSVSKRQTFIGGDTVEYGRISARTVAESIDNRGEVLLIYKMGQNSQEQRALGFRMEIEENYPGITIVQEVASETDTSRDADALKAALQANPDVDAIGSLVASGGVGAATAVRELGMQGKVKIIGDGKDNATLKLVEDGELESTITIKTVLEPYIGLKLLYLYNHTTVAASTDDQAAGVTILPPFIDVGTFVINQDSAKYFYQE
ncbi:MAG: substrate-binding domain-containing protein [Candidatus Cloacimonetes bacterium]|nr:substrate-binding domain-containing protein [Candidatus Cloacimonadota bacterium]